MNERVVCGDSQRAPPKGGEIRWGQTRTAWYRSKTGWKTKGGLGKGVVFYQRTREVGSGGDSGGGKMFPGGWGVYIGRREVTYVRKKGSNVKTKVSKILPRRGE